MFPRHHESAASVAPNARLTDSTHLHHLLRLDVDDQQPIQERLGSVDVLVSDVDG